MNGRTASRLTSKTCLKMIQRPSESANRPPLPKSPSNLLQKSKHRSSNRNKTTTRVVERATKMKKGKKVGIIRRVGEAVDVMKAITRWTIEIEIVIETETETGTEMEALEEADGTTIINEVEAEVIGVVVHKERHLSTIVMTMAAIIEVGGVEIAAEAVTAAAVEVVVVVGTEMTTSATNSTKTALTPPKTHLKKLIMIMNQRETRVVTKGMTIRTIRIEMSNNSSMGSEEEVAAGTVASKTVVDAVVEEEVDNVEVVEDKAVVVVEEVKAIKIHIISVT